MKEQGLHLVQAAAAGEGTGTAKAVEEPPEAPQPTPVEIERLAWWLWFEHIGNTPAQNRRTAEWILRGEWKAQTQPK